MHDPVYTIRDYVKQVSGSGDSSRFTSSYAWLTGLALTNACAWLQFSVPPMLANHFSISETRAYQVASIHTTQYYNVT